MNKRISLLRVFLGLVVLSLLLSPIGVFPVKAADTQLVIVPATTTASTCGETILRVRVENVTNLNAFEIRVEFSPDSALVVLAANVIDSTNGGFLDPGYYFVNDLNNDEGYFHIAFTQLSGIGKTGSGDLIEIRFRALEPGVDVNFTFDTSITKLSLLGGGPYIPYTSTGATVTTVQHTGTCTTLSLTPDPALGCVYDGVDHFDQYLYVFISDVEDLYSYDITINFTPGAIEILNEGWLTNANFLTNGSTLIFREVDNDNGIIHMYYSQQGGEPKDGSGNLMRIRYRVLVPDQEVFFTFDEVKTELVNWPDAFTIPKIVDDGRVLTSSCIPNAVDLLSFDGLRKPQKATLTWETANEMDNVGFNIYRSGFVDGVLKKRNAEIIPAEAVGTTMGAVYEFIDTPLKPWKTYFYWLESVDNEGNTTLSDPIKVKPPR